MCGIWVGVASVSWMLDKVLDGVEELLVGGAAFAAALSEWLSGLGLGLDLGLGSWCRRVCGDRGMLGPSGTLVVLHCS